MTNKHSTDDVSVVMEAVYGSISYWRDFGEEHVLEIEDDERLNDILWDILGDLEDFLDRTKLEGHIRKWGNDEV